MLYGNVALQNRNETLAVISALMFLKPVNEPRNDNPHSVRENSRIVAVAGMGRPGTFEVQGLRRVANELAFEIGSLPMVETEEGPLLLVDINALIAGAATDARAA